MDIFTHLVVGTLTYILFFKGVTFDYIGLAIFFSILPDLDILITPLKRIFKSNYLDHRGGSHSYIIGIMISMIGGIIYSLLTQQSVFMAWVIAIIFYSLHVSMDLLTTTKIPYLYPLSKQERSFYVEKAGSMFTMLNSVLFLVILGVLYYNSADLFLFNLFINIYTFFFIVYYVYRIASRIISSSHLKPNQKYLPGVLPFNYVIYEQDVAQNAISSSIEKKSHFVKKGREDRFNTSLNSEEMVLFKKGLELCNTDYYYAKWTTFPLFIRNGEIFSIKFFFLETMMNNRTMYIQFDFSIPARQLVGFNRGYGRIKS
jgi:membrane-bound metal-dependent hydrolase YbcI (DUF457 family)